MSTAKPLLVDLELRQMIEDAGISLNALSKELNIPRSSISLMISGRYENEEMRKKIVEYCQQRIRQREVFQTEGQRRILAVLDAALKDREFSLIVGPSGVGKTYTIQQFISKAKAKIVYFKVMKLMSAGECLRQLCEAVGVPQYGTNGMRLKRLKEALSEIDMLVVDEADLLVEEKEKYFTRKIEIFRELAEVTAVVLVGLPELDEAIYKNAKSYVYSRLGYYARVKEPTPEELFEFAKQKGLSSTEVVGAAVGRGFFRLIDKVAKKSREIGENMALALMYIGRR